MQNTPSRSTQRRFATSAPFLVVVLLAVSAGASEVPRVLYDCRGWNPGTPFSRPLGIFFDVQREECYVADTGNHQVVVCDRNGTAFYRFYHHVTRDGESVLGEPRSVVVDAQGRIFLTDAAAAYIDVLDPSGRSIGVVAPPDDECETAERFDCLALGPDGVYATLSCPQRKVAVIDDELRVARVIRLAWTQETEMSCITGVAVDAAGSVYVTDACASTMVQIYSAQGNYVRGFGGHDTGLENFSFPAGLALLRDGGMWVVDTTRQVASLFDSQGVYVLSIGGKGWGPGDFQYPSCLTTDGASRVFVVERGGNRYQCFHVGDSGTESELGLRH